MNKLPRAGGEGRGRTMRPGGGRGVCVCPCREDVDGKVRRELMRNPTMRIIQGQLSAEGRSFGIVISRFNSLVTSQLLSGAVDCLTRHGASDAALTAVYVPGSFEIPQAALQMAASGRFDALICLGCVIRGETPHFDYVAGEVTRGLGHIALQTGIPVGVGILTTDSLEQALERAGAKAGNKGWDAAMSAMELLQVHSQLKQKA
jgi:6,7-dimethyl-8-ribityllumazine synthase